MAEVSSISTSNSNNNEHHPRLASTAVSGLSDLDEIWQTGAK